MKQKNFFKVLVESMTNWIDSGNQKRKLEVQQQQQNQLNIYNQQMHLDLQYVLAEVLAQCNVSPLLQTVHAPQDLVLGGFQIFMGQPTIYYFSLCKTSSQKIPVYLLSQITDRINRMISMHRCYFMNYAITLDPQIKVQYFMNNRLMYNGFHVIDCKDNLSEIIIAVSIN